MRIVKFEAGGRRRVGFLEDSAVRDLTGRFESLAALLEAWMEDAEQLTRAAGQGWPLARVKLLSPVDPTSRVFAIAQNYPAHAAEYGGPRPPSPVIFLKLPSALAAPDEQIELPAVSSFFDYEGELGVVIGRSGRNISHRDALSYVVGYTVCNDGSARDLQNTTLSGKPVIDWFSAKAIDNSGPVGPWIVTKDDVPEPQNLRIQTRLNGEAVQDDRTSSMIFSLAEQIAYISQRLAIQPGDLIETGTPAGVGKARGRPLQAGDSLEIEVERVGVLRNRYVGPFRAA